MQARSERFCKLAIVTLDLAPYDFDDDGGADLLAHDVASGPYWNDAALRLPLFRLGAALRSYGATSSRKGLVLSG